MDIETRLAVLEANSTATLHALAAVFTAIAEMDTEAAAGIPALLEDMVVACAEQGEELTAAALENIAELAMTAASRGR